MVYAGEEARPGLFIAQRRGDKQEKRPGNKFGRKKSEINDGSAFPWAADEVACRGALRAVCHRASRRAKGGSGAVELHARCMEVERRFGEAVPMALELAGVAKQGRRGGEAPARRGAHAWGQQRRWSRAGVQFFKIYNFYVVQICTRSNDLKIFSKVQMNSNIFGSKFQQI